jgi:hypothetical protein
MGFCVRTNAKTGEKMGIGKLSRLSMSVLGVLLMFQPASAQTMYRCGSTYQDRPCDNAPASKTLQSNQGAKASSSAGTVAVTDVQCAGRGAEALKLTWQREAGKTLEQQLAGVTSPTQRALIEETYSIRASAPEVRSAIEAACVKRKEEALRAAALIEAARATDGAARPVGSTQNPSSAAQVAEAPKPQSRAEASGRPAQCDGIQDQLNRIKEQQRRGGSIALQEDLNAQRRELERRSSAAKC